MSPFRTAVVRSFALRAIALFPSLLFSNVARADGVAAGDRVRVHYAGGTVEGNVISTDNDTLLVKTEMAGIRVPIHSVQEISKQSGTKRHWSEGLLVGAGAGLVTGVAVAASTPDENEFVDDKLAIPYFAVLGAAAGAVVGAFIKTDCWTSVQVGSLEMGVNPLGHHGATLSLAWNF